MFLMHLFPPQTLQNLMVFVMSSRPLMLTVDCVPRNHTAALNSILLQIILP